MISEPELEGDLSAPATVPAPRGPEHATETLGADGSRLIPGPPLRRRPWVWGLTGVLVTSAVWAGALWAYGRAGPDLQGYGVSRNLCLDADLTALSAALGKKRDPFAAVGEDKALDQAVCTVNLVPKPPPKPKGHPGPTVRAYAEITYTLHKKTDPGPQFDASLIEPADQGAGEQILKLVPEVGERAYLVSRSGDESPSLEVLDGQAVLSLSVGQVTEYNDVDPLNPGFESDDQDVVHLGGLEQAMVEDMLALMDELRKK
ncbi:hypothetical protein ABZ353_11310 [Streptomyces niveus]|uniref:Uncharacterized protein n=2 Tax=Streptomyces niveus TaxID=193462 RepID=A0A1U9QR58_STRNV|nr:hypothetical protein [Streptomyces niveus]AQU66758.1 hypothetical protein BBN63_11385 [Streptomyces niveus]